ncbi:hypothetical protein CRENBAI_025836 [Crenichthys baileyi]|uniref:Uncharacterized protein n=1 Tax=Crenichthys baileyi TaxID=28760 RepID=A0AAV9QVG6_9TELE
MAAASRHIPNAIGNGDPDLSGTPGTLKRNNSLEDGSDWTCESGTQEGRILTSLPRTVRGLRGPPEKRASLGRYGPPCPGVPKTTQTGRSSHDGLSRPPGRTLAGTSNSSVPYNAQTLEC